MNQCKYCGKEIDNKHKFCNNSCAAKYNNAHRTRKPWTEEQKQRNRENVKQHCCKYCGKLLNKLQGEWKVCNDCRPYQKINLYDKLGISSGTLKDRYFQSISLLKNFYFEDKLSLTEIEKQTGVNISTIRKILTEDCRLRSIRESLHLVRLKGKDRGFGGSQFKHGWYITWEGKKIFYRSSYELEYALYLDEQQISYNVEDLRIGYFDTQKNEMRVAIPDFHLLDTNEIVEIKSSWTYDEQLMKDKFKAYKASGYIPKLILDKKEIIWE